MKLFAVYLVAAVAAVNAQRDALRSFRSADSVLFTFYDAASNRANLDYAPADPKSADIDGGYLNTTTLVYTTEGKISEYWGMTTSYETGKIYANNFRQSTLVEIDVNDSKVKTIARDLTSGLENLAFDRVTKTLYWTDSINKRIMAMDASHRHFAAVYESAEVSPYALALHPVKRKLFFSAYKLANDRISKTELIKCDLDGGNMQTLLRFPDVIRPRGMTIDFSEDKLYWTDMSIYRETVVMASDFDGKLKRQFFAKSIGYLWGIAHYKDVFYVTDIVNVTDNEYEIHIRNKDGRRGTTIKNKLKPRNVAIYGPNEVSRTKVTNECDENRCEHMCVASSSGSSMCKCSYGYQLKSGFMCETSVLNDNFLLVADIGQKRLFHVPIQESAFPTVEATAVPLDDETTEKIFAAALDPRTGTLAWYDLEHEELVWGEKRLEISGGPVSSIAIHCCKQQIFWASTSNIRSWDGKTSSSESLYVLSFFSNSEIRQITIDCLRDQIYWTEYDSYTRIGKVKRSDLLGRDVETVLVNIPVSKGITIDYETYTLHVMTMLDGLLYSLPLKLLVDIPSTSPTYAKYTTTSLKPNLAGNLRVVFDIRVMNGMVYLSDAKAAHLWRFSLRKGASSLEKYGPSKFSFTATLDAYSSAYFKRYIQRSCEKSTPPSTRSPATTVKSTGEGSESLSRSECLRILSTAVSGRVSEDFAKCIALLIG